MSAEEKPIVNKSSGEADKQPLRMEDLDRDLRHRIHVIRREFIRGLNFIRQHDHSVTFFGSARFDEGNPYYEKAVKIAQGIAESGIDIVTGGGPGIMEAANRGADQAEGEGRGHSLGLNISLPNEQLLNPYVNENESFHYFFSRKVALTFSAEAYLFFPGGFGTLDEFFEILTLVQTGKIVRVPIVLVGSDFWNPLLDFMENVQKQTFKTISEDDTDLFVITDNVDEVIEITKGASMRNE
ncbi:MAG: TIGR00730 family Rossman fold protein [Candidatus Paceibacterota bacterium]